MECKLQKIHLDFNSRIIVMSDIHGAITLFKKALKKISYNEQDVLIIVGDICEKGENSLELIRYLLKLKKTHEIYCVMGNCDTIYEDIENDDEENDQLVKRYMLIRKECLFNEMCKESNIEVNEQLDVSKMKEILRLNYQKEIAFLKNNPILLESEKAIFVHAGIENKPLNEQDAMKCLEMPSFMNQKNTSNKWILVGHWPVSNYDSKIHNNNIRIDKKKRMIGLDGGNGVKSGGQLNICVIEKGNMITTYVDNYPKIKACENQKQGKEWMNLIYPNTELNIIEKYENYSLCELVFSHEKREIMNDQIYEYKNKTYCEDMTIHDLEVKQGDILSLVKRTDEGCLVKKEGICGWYYGKWEEVYE